MNTIGVRAIGVAGVTVRNCDLAGFWVPLYLKDSAGSFVENNTIVGDPYGRLYANGSPALRVQGNRFVGPGATLGIYYGPETQVRDNFFDPASSDPYEYISVSIYGSPRSLFTGNESDGAVYVSFSNHSDASLAADNRLSGGSQITIGHSTDSVITRNRLGPVDPATLHANSGVSLFGASGNEISHNVIEGHRIWGISLIGDGSFGIGSDSNVVLQNTIHDASMGIYLYAASGNRILANELQQSWLGIAVLGEFGAAQTGGNVFQRNAVVGGEYGVLIASSGGNVFSGNTFREQVWGIFELQPVASDQEPNSYVENVLERSKLFGLLAWGSSPRILGNRFLTNGSDSYVPDDPTDKRVLSLLGDLRGGVALLPYVGDAEVTTLDDGDPSNDIVSAPLIGSSDQPNVFDNNGDIDIYQVDCHALNRSTLEHDNLFGGRPAMHGEQGRDHARIRQDWFGLVRVQDPAGNAVAEAMLEVRDARGKLAGVFTSASAGFAPSDPDPDRPQGLFDGEPGAPRPGWPRFTEFVIDESGRRDVLTPHQITVRSPSGMGRVRYSWDAVDNDPLDFRIVNGRYQTALVVLDKRRLGEAAASD
ncbi:MAG: right-handed parallel beta-helix repeat-containing protein [Candidatus Polarisedimenticolia bacterium]